MRFLWPKLTYCSDLLWQLCAVVGNFFMFLHTAVCDAFSRWHHQHETIPVGVCEWVCECVRCLYIHKLCWNVTQTFVPGDISDNYVTGHWYCVTHFLSQIADKLLWLWNYCLFELQDFKKQYCTRLGVNSIINYIPISIKHTNSNSTSKRPIPILSVNSISK